MTDHLALAKNYIAIAESGDPTLTLYKKAGKAIEAWLAEDRTRTQAQAARNMSVDRMVVTRALQAHRTGKVDWQSGSNKRDVVVAKALRDPERVENVLPDLPTRALQELADRADEVVAERRQARASEHQTGVTGRQVMDFKPDEYWMDKVTIRANRALREAAYLLEQGGGLFGAMTTEEAYEYWAETERLASEVRVALQERVRDEVRA